MAFFKHLGGERPSEGVFASFSSLCSEGHFDFFAKAVLQSLCEPSTPVGELGTAFLVLLSPAPKEELLAPYCAQSGIKQGVARRWSACVSTFLQGALKNNLNAGEVAADLQLFSVPKEKAEAVGELWAKNKAALMKAAADATLTVNQLLDIDWRFGVCASSKQLDKVGATFLQMKLTLDSENAEREKKIVNLELTLEQFYSFLAEMEKAESALSAFE